jgi:hypothetical protein
MDIADPQDGVTMNKICTAILAAGLFAGGVTSAAPKLELDRTIIDFGEIYDDAPVDGIVTLRNTGDARLIIDKVNTTCGCTVGRLAKRNLAPNETTTATLTYTPEGKKGDEKKTVTFVSNDPDDPAQKVTVKAYVIPQWEVVPDKLEFITRAPEPGFKNRTVLFQIINNSEEDLTIINVDSRHPEVKIENNKPAIIPPGESRDYTARVRDKFNPRRRVISKVMVVARIGEVDQLKKLPIRMVPQ